MTIQTLEELKDFERQQKERVEQTKADSLNEIEVAKKEIDKKIAEERRKLEKKKQESVEKAKEKAKEESRIIEKEYQDRIKDLQNKSSKNFGKAAERILSLILGKNV